MTKRSLGRARGVTAALGIATMATAGGCTCGRRVPVPENVVTTETAAIVDAARPTTGRCVPRGNGAALRGATTAIEIGLATPTPSGIAVGFVRPGTKGARAAIVATAAADLSGVVEHDLGALDGDDPPPRPIWAKNELFALRHVRDEKTHGLAMFRVDSAARLWTVAPLRDDTVGYDAVLRDDGGIVAWSEDVPTEDGKRGALVPAHGAVRVATIDADLAHASDVRTVSGLSDAEWPRVARRPGGYWVAWIARRADLEAGTGASSAEREALAEGRVFGWIEVQAVDAHGAPASVVRRVGDPNGRVASFEIVPQAAPAAADAEIALLVQEGDATDPTKPGRIVRYTVTADKVSPPDVVVAAGVRGAFDVFPGRAGGGGAWLLFDDAQERTQMAPLAAAGQLAAEPMPEPFETERPIAVLGDDTVVVAAPSDPRATLRAWRCARK